MEKTAAKEFLSAYEKFSEIQKDLILKVAPKLRMLRQQKQSRSIIQAYPWDQKYQFDEAYAVRSAKPENAVDDYLNFASKNNCEPAYLLLDNSILFCIADTAENAYSNYLIASGQKSGQPLQETAELPRFAPSVYQKVCFVTGAAQGLGKGISDYLAEKGAYIIIADLNEAGAMETADEFNEKYGLGKALSIKINVADEEDVQKALKIAVAYYGGIDVLVSNAGVVRAGSLDELSAKDFNFVTMINYNAYFLMAKYTQKIMKLQHEINPDYWMDIIQINSKSGLAGSKNNFAYAGSKFGGIGLTQSFALELADYHIKVNSVCPGNNLDGPLWSDPINGLYVQYLHSGKVKGAKTVEDVREYYLGKVPMHKGVVPSDLGKAVCYLVEQENETGQALPVSGGQEMLK